MSGAQDAYGVVEFLKTGGPSGAPSGRLNSGIIGKESNIHAPCETKGSTKDGAPWNAYRAHLTV